MYYLVNGIRTHWQLDTSARRFGSCWFSALGYVGTL